MNKNRKTSHILNVFQFDANGHVILPATLTIGENPHSSDNTSKIPSTSWIRTYVTGLSYLTGNQSITVSGDATGSGTTAITLTLANTAVTPGTYGSTTLVPVVTVDSKGRITSVTTAAISGSLTFTGDVTGTGTTGTSTGLTLAASGVTAGTYTKVTVDSKGRVTVGASASTTDIAEGTNLYYTDARVGTYLTANSYATQSYVGTQIANLVASAPATLDTLNELSVALGNDPNFATSVATSIGTKQAQLNGTGFVKVVGTTVSYDNNTYLTSFTETDPTVPSHVKSITTTEKANWNTAYGWGNHAIVGYLTSVPTHNQAWSTITSTPTTISGYGITNAYTDAQIQNFFNGANAITGYNKSNWDTAYGWGNHASGGYLTGITSSQVTTALGYTPYNSTNPSGYITGITSANVTTALGFTPYNATNPSGYLTQTTADARYLYATSSPSTPGNFTLSIGNNGTYSYVQSHSGQPLELNPVGNAVRISGNVAIHAGNYSSYAVPTGRTITINGTGYDLSADRSWTISGTDSTKLPLAGGTMTGTIGFSNVTGNKIDFYYSGDDRYGIQVQSSELRIHSGAQGANDGGITFGKSTGSVFTEHLRIRNDGIIQAVGSLLMATSGTSYIRMGRFPNSTSNGGEAWIGRASDRNPGTMTVQLGGGSASSRSFEVVDYAWSTVLFSVNSNGNISASGTVTGSNLSGTNTGDQTNISGNAATAGGLAVHAGRNNEANKIVRTDGNGYIQAGYINSTSGNENNNSNADRVWGTNGSDDYLRTYRTSALSVGTAANASGVSFQTQNNSTWGARMQLGGNGDPGSVANVAVVQATDGNLHMDCGTGKSMYLNYYRNGIIYLNGGTYNISANGSYYNGTSSNSNTVGGYSVDVAGSANTIPTRNASGYLIPQNWIQFNGAYGIYSGTNSAHFYPNDRSYGSWKVLGERNSWRGLHFGEGTGMTLMMNETEFGFHREAHGWYARFTNGRFYGACDNVYNLDYALGNTHYWTAVNYFQTNNGGQAVNNSNTAKLEAYSTGNNSAFMSFHKGAHYAINMGLDDDNVFRIGGWSASGNRLQMDMSGNLTMAGDVTAYSDARVKENIVTVDNALNKVLALRGVYYNRIDSDDKKTKIGVIAQETLPIVPEVVNQDNDGMFNVSYGNLAGLFIEAIKEQQKEIEELKTIIYGLTR
jgi:hypothetical protein